MELSPSLISHQASVDVKPYLLLLKGFATDAECSDTACETLEILSATKQTQRGQTL